MKGHLDAINAGRELNQRCLAKGEITQDELESSAEILLVTSGQRDFLDKGFQAGIIAAAAAISVAGGKIFTSEGEHEATFGTESKVINAVSRDFARLLIQGLAYGLDHGVTSPPSVVPSDR